MDNKTRTLIPLKKPNLRRCFNFPVTATYDKCVSFLENFSPCILGFLSEIMFHGFCSVIIFKKDCRCYGIKNISQ